MITLGDAKNELNLAEDIKELTKYIENMIDRELSKLLNLYAEKIEFSIKDFPSRSFYDEPIRKRLFSIYNNDSRFSEIKLGVNTNCGKLSIRFSLKLNPHNETLKEIVKENEKLKPYIELIDKKLIEEININSSKYDIYKDEGIFIDLSYVTNINCGLLQLLRDKYIQYSGWKRIDTIYNTNNIFYGLVFYLNK